MSKRSKRKFPNLAHLKHEGGPSDLEESTLGHALAAETHPHKSLPLSLDDIRRQALIERTNVAHTIADLEAWRAEIEATIAFLRGR